MTNIKFSTGMQNTKNGFNRKIFGIIFVISFVFGGVMVLPLDIVSAAEPTDSGFQLVPTDCGTSYNTDNGDAGVTTVSNECGWSHLMVLVSNVMKFLVYIAVSIGVLACCYAGFLYITAFGEMGKVEQAHKIFSTTITGMLIILLAWLIVATILKNIELSSSDFSIINYEKAK